MREKTLMSCSLFLSIFIIFFTVSCGNNTNNPQYSKQQIQKGETLVMEGKCNFCHTPEVAPDDDDNGKILYGHPAQDKIPDIPRVPAGSQQWMEFVDNLDSTVWIAGNKVVFSANITPDKETGIGNWSEDDFINTIRTGKHPGWKRELNKPMPWLDYAKLSNEQLINIFAYLMSQQPVKNKVPEPITIKE